MNLEHNASKRDPDVLAGIMEGAKETENAKYFIDMIGSCRTLGELNTFITSAAEGEAGNREGAESFFEYKTDFAIMLNQLDYIRRAVDGQSDRSDYPNSLLAVISNLPNTPYGPIKMKYGFGEKVEELLKALEAKKEVQKGIVDVEL